MRAIWGLVIAIAVIFGTISYANAYEENAQTEHQVNKNFATNSLDQFNFFVTTKSPLIEDSSFESKTNFHDGKIVYEIVLIPHPCDPLSKILVIPDDPSLDCKKDFVDAELLDFINEIAIRTIGFPIDLEEILFSEVTNLDELEEQIFELDSMSELIFEHEVIDVSTTTSQFEEQIENSDPESAEYLESKLEEKVEEIRAEYQIIKDKWKEKINELQNDAQNMLNENPGMKAKILKQDIEKMKIRFDLKQDKIKDADDTMKKIKTAIELNNLKKNFQDSMNEYEIIEKTIYGAENDKKLEQLKQKNTELLKLVLIADAKHNGKKLDEAYLKEIEQNVSDLITNSADENNESAYGNNGSEIIGSSNGNNEGGQGNGNGSDKGKGSNNGKGSGKGNSKK